MKFYLFKNARIHPISSQRIFHWMAVCCGKILALGDRENTIPPLKYKRIFDFQGKTILPAFGDAHLHSLWIARRFFEPDLSGADTMQEALRRLQHFAQSHSIEWIIGRGFNKNLWKDGQPHRKYLDELFPTQPVFLQSLDCHSAWVNSEALKRCKINAQTPDPPGGRIEKENGGLPTGVLYDHAVELVTKHIPQPSTDQVEFGALQFVKRLHSFGVTTVHTMEDTKAFVFWQSFLKKHPQTLRITIYFKQDELETLIKAGLRSGFGDAWLRIGGVKFFSDGSLGSQTALLSQPYEGTKDFFGLELMDVKELRERIHLSECNGLAVAVHAIGDRAVERVLKILKQSENCRKKFGLVSRIEHAQLIRPDLLPLFKQYGLVASMQPIHIADDVPTAERYWGVRSRWAYAFRSLTEAGVPLSFGSDAPVAEPNPLKGIFSAVQRRFKFSLTEPSWHPEEALTPRQAVAAFTLGIAQAVNQQQNTGSLEPGKFADFIVLNRNPFTVPEEDLLSVKVEQTFLAGELVYPL